MRLPSSTTLPRPSLPRHRRQRSLRKQTKQSKYIGRIRHCPNTPLQYRAALQPNQALPLLLQTIPSLDQLPALVVQVPLSNQRPPRAH